MSELNLNNAIKNLVLRTLIKKKTINEASIVLGVSSKGLATLIDRYSLIRIKGEWREDNSKVKNISKRRRWDNVIRKNKRVFKR